MSFDTEHKTIQMEEATSHDQLALDALERRRQALEEVHIATFCPSLYQYIFYSHIIFN